MISASKCSWSQTFSALREQTSEELATRIKEWCSEAAEKASLETKTRQKQKFDRLVEKHESGSLDPKRVVKNISNRSLSVNEEKVDPGPGPQLCTGP